MRDIPVFTTEYGVASLTLQDIPYRGTAYIKIQSTAQPKEFLDECVDFCIAAGAERVYAAGHDFLAAYPLHTALWQMSCPASACLPMRSIWPSALQTESQKFM